MNKLQVGSRGNSPVIWKVTYDRTAHLQAIPAVLQDYLNLRMKLTQDVVMAEPSTNGAVEQQPLPTDMQRWASRPASFSSASLTPITDSPPSTRSLSPRQIHDDSPIDDEEEEEDDETEDIETSLETVESVPPDPKSIELIKRIATLATDAVRGSQEKVNLSNAAFAAVRSLHPSPTEKCSINRNL